MLKMGDEVVFPENGPYHICRHNLLALVHVQIGCVRLDSGKQRVAVHVNAVKDNADAVWVGGGVVYENRVVQQFRYLASQPFRQPMGMMVALEATFALHGVPKVLLRVEKGQLLEPHLQVDGRCVAHLQCFAVVGLVVQAKRHFLDVVVVLGAAVAVFDQMPHLLPALERHLQVVGQIRQPFIVRDQQHHLVVVNRLGGQSQILTYCLFRLVVQRKITPS